MEIDRIYNTDCLVGMKEIPDKSIDAIICDLPYSVLHKSNPNTVWDVEIPFAPLWEQYERVIKDNGAILLFGQNLFTAKLVMSNPKLFRYTLVWDKTRATGFLNANRMPLRRHEDIAVFYKSLPTYHPQMIMGEPNHSRGNGEHKETNRCYGKYKHNGVYDVAKRSKPTRPGMKFPTSIIRFKKEHSRAVLHPTQKPVDLVRYLIRTYTDVGVIMDNCMGSGTTAIAAMREGRHFVGFETDRNYFDIALKRIEVEQTQLG